MVYSLFDGDGRRKENVDVNVKAGRQDTKKKTATYIRVDARPIAADIRLLTPPTPHPLGQFGKVPARCRRPQMPHLLEIAVKRQFYLIMSHFSPYLAYPSTKPCTLSNCLITLLSRSLCWSPPCAVI